ncbi:MAG: phosphatase PAP2 family protein [Candidatus Uhrbacteria bacterium]|nr:phosphatase PAP2 family protein [Candidatus Uhrbacteria bacterium]
MDTQLFLLIHGLAGQSPILDTIGIFFAKYAIYIFVSVLALGVWHRRKSLTHIVLSLVFALALNHAIAYFFFRPRPFVTLYSSPLIDGIANTSKSFPSDHTALSFAAATVFALAYPRLQWIGYVFAFAIGFARIFAGVHYPGDILGGIGIGILSGFVVLDLSGRVSNFYNQAHGKRS